MAKAVTGRAGTIERHGLSDEQLVALLTYLRASAAAAPPWPDLAARVRDSKEASR